MPQVPSSLIWQGVFDRAHAKRVCSERFSALSVPISGFGAQINQPLVAPDSKRDLECDGYSEQPTAAICGKG
jgi:hypothetical protein